MRRYHPYVPIRSTSKSISEDMDAWNKNKCKANTSTAVEIEEEHDIDTNRKTDPRTQQIVAQCLASDEMETSEMTNDMGVHFMLQTAAGTLSYKPSEYSNYTDFLRVVIEMSLAFNSTEIDPEFKKVIKKAFAAYEGTEDFDDEDDNEYDNSEPEDIDFVPSALEIAKNEAEKWEKGVKYIDSLPKSETLTLKILQPNSESTKTRDVEKMLSKMTDFPPNVMHAIIHNNESFSLPFKQASDVYVQLRMLGIPLTVKSARVGESKTTMKAASKKSVKKSTANSGRKKKTSTKKVSAKKRSVTNSKQLTGSEKLRTTVGIIKSE